MRRGKEVALEFLPVQYQQYNRVLKLEMGKEFDEKMMRRALQLARFGYGSVSPNPMVGCVITKGEKIIGEGWHRRFGGPHAEVNAVASVGSDTSIEGSTVYVTLEPCSHYGKTPPCAEMLARLKPERVVVAMTDDNPVVHGKGIEILRRAGIKIESGLLEDEARELNIPFITAHTLKRPFVLLKWAQTADGFIAGINAQGKSEPVRISNSYSMMMMHRLRAGVDAVMVGTDTVISDNPQLTTRLWPGKNPVPVTFNRNGRLPENSHLAGNPSTIVVSDCRTLPRLLSDLFHEHGIISVMVEGGRQLLQSFIDAELWDEARIETAPFALGRGVSAPEIKGMNLVTRMFGNNSVQWLRPLGLTRCGKWEP